MVRGGSPRQLAPSPMPDETGAMPLPSGGQTALQVRQPADLAALAGIANGVSFEQLRWTCAVRDYRNGMPPERLREKLGLSLISWRETLPKIQKLARPAL